MISRDDAALARRTFLRLAALAAAGGFALPAWAETEAGLVTVITGDASAQLRSRTRALSADGPVFVGDRVATSAGARAHLRLGGSTELRLGEKARITIDRFLAEAGGTITLGAGALLLDKPPETAPVQIRSSYALIAVRGTQIFAGPSNGVFGVFVARGSVAVRAAGQQVVLTAGEGTDIARHGGAPGPVKRWGEARIRAAMAQVDLP